MDKHQQPEVQLENQPIVDVKSVTISSPLLTWMMPCTTNPAYKNLTSAYRELLQQPVIRQAVPVDHLEKTPYRVVKALFELLEGYQQDPVEILKTGFSKGTYDQMITVGNIEFASLCSHHMLPFTGKVHFAYIPRSTIVGLSKIPRMVEAFSRRLQIQEHLSEDIASCFQDTVKPKGCAVLIEAKHMCASLRGIKKERMFMRTTALRGIFLKDPSTKLEFLASINHRS